MTEIIQGHCLCGFVRYEYSGDPGPANYCHCEDCRRHTGSAFNVGVRFEREKFKIVNGEPGSYTKQADSGNSLTRHFCPRCGSPLFTSSDVHPDYIYVKAGTLDDPAVVKPDLQIWYASAVPWSKIPDNIPRHRHGRTSELV